MNAKPNMRLLRQPQADEIVALTKAVGAQVRLMLEKPIEIKTKQDGSSVTSVDLAAHHMLCDGFEANGVHYKGLNEIAPGIQILSEEDELNHLELKKNEPFFTLDPVDGTSKLIKYAQGDKDSTGFSIMVGLVENGAPTFGAVHYPVMGAHGTSYFTNAGCNMLYEQAGDVTPRPLTGLKNMTRIGNHKAIVLGNQPEDMMLGGCKFNAEPYSELDRMLRLAKGIGHVAYNNYTMHPPGYWDLAPFQAMFEAAGGALMAFDKTQQALVAPHDVSASTPMRYDGTHDASDIKPGPYLHKSVAAAPDTLATLGCEAMRGRRR